MIWNDRIKARRKELGYTLKEVAAKLGIAESTAQRYESKNGIKNIPYEALVKYASILSTTPDYIMGWKDDPSAPAENSIPDLFYDSDNMMTHEEFARLMEINSLSNDEYAVITAYRNASPEIKFAIRAVLGAGR